MKVFIAGDVLVTTPKKSIVSDELRQIILSADIAVCNLEGPLKGAGHPIPKAGPHVFQNPVVLSLLRDAGFNACSAANNHIYDYGESGLSETMETASRTALHVFGAGLSWDQAYAMNVQEVNGMRIGFFSFCEAEFGCLLENRGHGGYAYVNDGSLCHLIAVSRKRVDLLFILVHAGVEDIPLPLPEWRRRYRELCDYGADAVLAHHPHVPQGWEIYNGKPVFYSLGNFHFDSDLMKDSCDPSYSVMLEIKNNALHGFQVVTHEKTDGLTTLNKDPRFTEEVNKLCHILSDRYEERVNEFVLSLYETLYKRYYLSALSGIDQEKGRLYCLARALKLVFTPRRARMEKELLLLHNLKIDSHRYLVQRALGLRCEIL